MGGPSAGPAGSSPARGAERSDEAVLRTLAALSAGIARGRRVDQTLEELVQAVVRETGFGVAAHNAVLPDGDIQVAAVAGTSDAREQLIGRTIPRREVDDLLARAEHWGDLRFVPHGERAFGEEYEWVPDIPVPEDPDAWHPEDMLLAPIYGSEGSLVGLLSVDLPPGLRRPGPDLCELLEMFAIQAGIAIDNARLVAELRRERDRLAASEAAYRFMFTESVGGMGVLSLDEADFGTVLQANEALATLFGFRGEDLAGRNWFDLVVEPERPASRAKLTSVRAGSLERADRQMLRRDGTVIWVSIRGAKVPTATAARFVCLLHVDDITERKIREVELLRQANADPLTGVGNRRALLAHLDATIGRVDPTRPAGAVVYADLNTFKDVNDQFGHATGDLVLKEAARRLAAEVRKGDIVARLGGDEFAIVAAEIDAQHAENLLARIRTAFDTPMTACPDGRVVTVSLGWVLIAGRSETAVDLLHRADLSMFSDKAVTRGERA
jgi:diguanylate cyclase (GGDEF)-like protein/PAS domain S-box-containing protein